MKKHLISFASRTFSVLVFVSLWTSTLGQTDKDDIELVQDSKDAVKEFIQTDGLMQNLFTNAYGYVIFPSIGKGAFGVGGAAGSGTVVERGATVGKAKMTQVTIGFQVGGQAYREVVFFQEKSALDRFKENNVEFSAQVSAVAAKSGASGNAKYTDGILIFTQQKGGLMYEASVGGQKFKYTAFSK